MEKTNFNVVKKSDGKKNLYYFGGKLVRKSARDFAFACIATSQQTGRTWVISLGNTRESTYNSMARFYKHYCDLEVITVIS